jgi:hypothetical protein
MATLTQKHPKHKRMVEYNRGDVKMPAEDSENSTLCPPMPAASHGSKARVRCWPPRVEHPFSMPHEHFDVFYCRGLRLPLKVLWPQVKNWD